MRSSRDSNHRHDGGVMPDLDMLLFQVGLARDIIPFP